MPKILIFIQPQILAEKKKIALGKMWNFLNVFIKTLNISS